MYCLRSMLSIPLAILKVSPATKHFLNFVVFAKLGGVFLDILAILNRIEGLLKESGRSKSELYAACSLTSSAISQWKSGKTSPSTKSLQRIADYLNVSYEYLILGVGQKRKTPALTEKDKRDIARDLERIMETLETAGDLQFDGDPMSDEARESIKAAMKLGLEAAKLKNKERFTPKKYRQE